MPTKKDYAEYIKRNLQENLIRCVSIFLIALILSVKVIPGLLILQNGFLLVNLQPKLCVNKKNKKIMCLAEIFFKYKP